MGAYNAKEWFNISEMANIVGCSRPTVYKKLSTIDSAILQTLQKREKNITYYHYKVIDKLKAILSPEEVVQEEAAADASSVIENLEQKVDYEFEYIQDLRGQIEFLKEQLKAKDELISKHVKLVENEQILRREEHKTYALMDEERSRQVDEKLQAWRKAHYEELEQETESEGFFKRLFKKKT